MYLNILYQLYFYVFKHFISIVLLRIKKFYINGITMYLNILCQLYYYVFTPYTWHHLANTILYYVFTPDTWHH